MKTSMRLEFPRLCVCVAWMAVWPLLGACDDGHQQKGSGTENAHGDWKRVGSATPARRDLDVLFVMDNSSQNSDQLEFNIGYNIHRFFAVLDALPGGAPNLHFGVATNDLGSAPYNIPGCETPGGLGGRLFKGQNNFCVSPVNQTYLIDVEPHGCTVVKTATPGSPTTCTNHDCTQANCEPIATDPAVFPEPAGLTLAVDEHGCPRCRNLGSSTLASTLQCLVRQGTSGCFIEQPLEAMRLALTDSSGDNAGFLRTGSDLAILLISDEDDCSVQDSVLFIPEDDPNSELGILETWRCTEFGVVCDEPWVRPMPVDNMTYHNCRPREAEDPLNLLHPIERYVDALHGLRTPERLKVSALAGPFNGTVEVIKQRNYYFEEIYPTRDYACGGYFLGAEATVRLQAFVQQFHDFPVNLEWPSLALCSDFAQSFPALAYGYVARFADAMSQQTCVNQAVFGCPDPSFAAGGEKTTQLPDDIARVCAPECEVVETDDATTLGEATMAIPLCDPTYAAGHPPLIDPSLPVPACWHLVHDDFCLGSMDALRSKADDAPLSGARIVISLRAQAAAGAAWDFRCRRLPARESTCDDGVDNDQDGAIDGDDADCG